MPDPAGMGPVAPWPAPFSHAFIEQARTLLEVRGVLVVIAPVGAGRQRLAADIAEAPEGPVWFRHVARYGERDRPYFALQQIFSDLHLPVHARPDDVEDAVLKALHDIEAARPRLVLANTDLCDPESVEMLVSLARRQHIRLIATLTPETVDEHARLLSSAEVIDIPPLDAATVGELLEVRFGAQPHQLLVDLLMARTGGSYAAVRDVADASFAAGLFTIVENVLVTDPDSPPADCFTSLLSPQSAARLGGGEQITDLIHLTALLGLLDVDEARACVPSDVVDLATAHGTFTLTGGRLAFAARSEETLVQRSLSGDRQRELFEKFAARVPRTLLLPGVAVRAADWWLAIGRSLPLDLARRAAREANLMGRHRRAVVYTDPAANDERADVAVVERVFALAELGDLTALRDVVTRTDPETLTEDELLVYLRWMPAAIGRDDRDELHERAVAVDDPLVRRRRVAVRSLAEQLVRIFDSASDDSVNRLRSLAFSSQLSPCNRATAFSTLSAVLRQAGRPAQAVEAAQFALRILADERDTVSAFHLDMAHELHIMALISAVDLDGAAEAAREYSSGLFGYPGSGRLTAALQVLISMLQGDIRETLASARLCLAALRPHDPHQIRGWVEAMLAQTLIQTGRVAEAKEYLVSAEGRPSARRQLDLDRRLTLATCHDALAEPEEALRMLAEAADEAQEHGLRLALISSAVLGVQIGGPPHLPVLLDVVDDLVDPTGEVLVAQTFARAIHRYDLAALTKLAEHLDRQGARLFAAEVAQYVLDMARRSTDLDPDTRERLRGLADPT